MDFKNRAERYAPTHAENEELLAWLRTEVPESVLEPELPIIDPHRETERPSWRRRRHRRRRRAYLNARRG